MGISTLEFKGKAMDYSDSVIEIVLRLIIKEIDKIKMPPDWLKVLREDWDIISTQEFGFGTIPDLKPLLVDKSRQELILSLTLKALENLKSFGDPISKDVLNSLGAGNPEALFPKDLEAKIFIKVFEDLIRLLNLN